MLHISSVALKPSVMSLFTFSCSESLSYTLSEHKVAVCKSCWFGKKGARPPLQ